MRHLRKVLHIIGIALLISFIPLAQQYGLSVSILILLLALASFVVAGLIKKEKIAMGKQAVLGWPEALINEKTITITSYPYQYSSFLLLPIEIELTQISCVFNSYDVGVVINNNEILFLPIELKQSLEEFAQRNSIPIPKIPDVWQLLAEPFLDTQYLTEENDYAKLEELSFNRQEVKSIRNEISSIMLNATIFSMREAWYSSQDILRAFAVFGGNEYSSQFYWKLMAYALRPYK